MDLSILSFPFLQIGEALHWMSLGGPAEDSGNPMN